MKNKIVLELKNLDELKNEIEEIAKVFEEFWNLWPYLFWREWQYYN